MAGIFSDDNIDNWVDEYVFKNKDELIGVFDDDAQKKAEECGVERYNNGLEEGFRDGILFILHELGIRK